eukprot:1187543-Prorocentrum_minimum.AAC.1
MKGGIKERINSEMFTDWMAHGFEGAKRRRNKAKRGKPLKRAPCQDEAELAEWHITARERSSLKEPVPNLRHLLKAPMKTIWQVRSHLDGPDQPQSTPSSGMVALESPSALRNSLDSTRCGLIVCVRLVRRENIPVLPASDWSVVRIYLCVLRLIGLL